MAVPGRAGFHTFIQAASRERWVGTARPARFLHFVSGASAVFQAPAATARFRLSRSLDRMQIDR